jgi:hypothetical protein
MLWYHTKARSRILLFGLLEEMKITWTKMAEILTYGRNLNTLDVETGRNVGHYRFGYSQTFFWPKPGATDSIKSSESTVFHSA